LIKRKSNYLGSARRAQAKNLDGKRGGKGDLTRNVEGKKKKVIPGPVWKSGNGILLDGF